MRSGICYIFGASDFSGRLLPPKKGDYMIAADGGYAHLSSLGIVPDLVVGDFDSLGDMPNHPHILRHPVEKDDTDTMLAVKTGLELGFREFLIYGGLGGHRLDHTVANLQTLSYIAEHGGRGYLLDEETVITAVKNGTLRFSPRARGTVSVFCLGADAEGVSLTGLKYPLNGATLTHAFPLGVSNSFTGAAAAVTVARGTVTVLWEKDITYCLDFSRSGS